ncbi:hypothetical protein VP1G_04703 [Cytospora mali]|uniref:Uncharacterized protein n=1 Tax=Cytospora mali TaxID=578113 RepID=A0A194V0A4_CYTMA|nr:hypothetical protein VP1G_04703 [Valsa mali var. pyri (nom. inval.)]
MERIREASAKELFPIILNLCDRDVDILRRVMNHMQLLINRNTLHDSPGTTEHVRHMTETDLRAIVLTICEDDVAMQDRVLDYLRLLEIFQLTNDHHGEPENSLSDGDSEISDSEISDSESSDTERGDTSHHLKNFTCGHCQEVFNEETNHAKACKRHTDDLERSSESGTFIWTCCRHPAGQHGCIKGWHEQLS